ncbi:MAG: hypothetical protein G3M78_02645 [Candidatus Nitrohelix vancouverensis]|uniref:Uncharacterized protein n=1 Tax=Candidatus Nitrohelix vancouverensis TaxID=2705534 RepID=A0A7T0G2L9_9BACT|nr:MAG: hypothetical protein G3M78_02645 [Candidatus Nitrohelix vancouverensis]
MTTTTTSLKEQIEALMQTCTELATEADKRRQTASTKFEYYKFEFSDGERNAYETIAKKLKSVLDKAEKEAAK